MLSDKLVFWTKNKQPKVFLLCLLLSVSFWFLAGLSKEYEDTIRFKVIFDGIPRYKMLQGSSVHSLHLHIKARGFSLINYKIFGDRKLHIDLSKNSHKKGNAYYWLPSENQKKIVQQLKSETRLLSVKPDTIFLSFEKKIQKKIPVVADMETTLKKGYNFSDALHIIPDSVQISGPKKLLSKITQVKTEKILLKNVQSDIEEQAALLLKNTDTIQYSVSTVTLKRKVQKFTETSISIPFEVINLPKQYHITTFPGEVKITYQVALSDYNKIVPGDFKVICDYQYAKENDASYLIPKIVSKPEEASAIRISPTQIEFLLKQ